MITLIAAVDEHNAIGKGDQLLWHLPEDFKHFKRLTTGHCIIMGRKTFETFPKPLPNRTHIVITRQEDYAKEGVIVVSSVEEAIEKALTIDPNPYVIGGGEIYAQALPLADVIELTRVHHTFREADVFFPEFSSEEWDLVASQHYEKDERHAYDFTFERYVVARS
ncbi:dihydrofolate reductase [Capnocytophaga sp. HP1101]